MQMYYRLFAQSSVQRYISKITGSNNHSPKYQIKDKLKKPHPCNIKEMQRTKTEYRHVVSRLWNTVAIQPITENDIKQAAIIQFDNDATSTLNWNRATWNWTYQICIINPYA